MCSPLHHTLVHDMMSVVHGQYGEKVAAATCNDFRGPSTIRTPSQTSIVISMELFYSLSPFGSNIWRVLDLEYVNWLRLRTIANALHRE